MKIAPITHTEIAIVAVVLVGGYFSYRAYSAARNLTPAKVIDAAATAVDQREDGGILGDAQSWFANQVEKGQRAGSTSFLGSFFTGITK